jgi:2-hydroxychromene-2-carboxylate isomerase
MKSLEYFFDYTCPFAYLASTQVTAEYTYRPILLGGVFKAIGQAQNLSETLGPAKAVHNLADMQRWAKKYGVTLRMPNNHPMRSVEALRATLATGIDRKVVDGFFRAYWVENRDIAERDVIADVLTKAGHDAGAVIARAAEHKDDLRKRTDEAVARGVFGVPTFIVDGKELYWGQDRMHLVRALEPTTKPARLPSGRTVEVFWDFSSPFAYLASTQLGALATRTGATVASRPMLLGGLFKSIGQNDVPLSTFSESKQRHVMNDLHRWAAYWKVPFVFPSRFPMNTVKALRVWYALPAEARDGFRDACFRAYWAEDQDIGDDAVLARCVGDEALAKEALAKTASDDVKLALRRTTEEAAAKGVFGAPTFIVDGEVYWGQDRLEMVEDVLVRGLA